MTPPDHDPLLDDEPLDDDTLAVHAVVDDEATPEQRRRVARDPALVAQVASLRAVVEAVAAPIDAPGEDVLAAIRARAIDTALADDPVDEPPAPSPGPPPATAPAPAEPYAATPVRDLSRARARRARRLPPLPAVAAVVILLVLVGVSLLASGGSDDEDQADSGSSALTASGDDASGGGSDGGGDTEGAASETSPSGEFQRELLADAVARYDDEQALLDELRRTDPEDLSLAGQVTTGAEDSPPSTAASTTTTPETNGESSETTTSVPDVELGGRDAEAYAATPNVQRCDSVLRSAERDLGPVVAAVVVDLDGIPVLVLSNPIEATDDAPAGLRLTVLNAVDCAPRAAVVR